MLGLIRVRLNGQQRNLLAGLSRQRGFASAEADDEEAAGLLMSHLMEGQKRAELGGALILQIGGYQLFWTADQWEPEPEDTIRQRLDEILKVVRGIDSGETV